MELTDTEPCPCESGRRFGQCCGPVLAGRAAATAEALMRSRYTAWVLENPHYLRESWHPRTRPPEISVEPGLKWLGLKIVRTEAGTETDQHGIVEFVARYKIGGRGHRLHETSTFERLDGRWVYVSG